MNDMDTENLFSRLSPLNRFLCMLLVVVSIMAILLIYLGKRNLDFQHQQENDLKAQQARLGLLANLYQVLTSEKQNAVNQISPLDNLKTIHGGVYHSSVDRVRQIAKNRHMVLDWFDDISGVENRRGKGKCIGLSLMGTFLDFRGFLLELSTDPSISSVSGIQIFSGSVRLDIMVNVEFGEHMEKQTIPVEDKQEHKRDDRI